jgi:uncharacterized membrane protein
LVNPEIMRANLISGTLGEKTAKRSKVGWIIFVMLAIVIGFYPIFYLLEGFRSQGFLSTKALNLRQSAGYLTLFYIHVTFGGLSLLIGWSQFSERFRRKYLQTHRSIGKVYVVSVLLSSLAGMAIALFATGGAISVIGFEGLAICWLFSDIRAYTSIRKGRIQEHQDWMCRNYALTFAAVTLRLWLPFSQVALHMDFVDAYRIIAWMCWVPNLIVAELIINRTKRARQHGARLHTA